MPSRSVANAVDYVGGNPVITADPAVFDDCSHIILLGVGAFASCMEGLAARGLVEILERQVRVKGKPMLGICVGAQMLARAGLENGRHQGLGWLDAEVVPFDRTRTGRLKVPHMGWNRVDPVADHPLFAHLKGEQMHFYFVHSYHLDCCDPADVLATCTYGYPFTAVVRRDNIVATQFHPEKSQDSGIQIYENFINWSL